MEDNNKNNGSATPAPLPPRPQILLQGDSLTQLGWEGWAAHVAHVYQRRADVLNRGYSGYNTRFYLRLPVVEENAHRNVVLATLFFGANDQALPGLDDHHHVPVDEFRRNLQQLIQQTQTAYGCRRILVMGPPPVHHEQRLAYQIERYGKEKATGKLERTMDTARQYSDACQQVARDAKLPFLNLYQDMQQDDDWGRFFCDGLHFAKAGHDFVGQAVVRAINQAYPELAVQPDPRTGQWCNSQSQCPGLPDHGGGPFHDQIDHRDLDKSFGKLEAAAAASATNKKRKDMSSSSSS